MRLVAIVAAATLCFVPASAVAAPGAASVPFHAFVAGLDGDLRHLPRAAR